MEHTKIEGIKQECLTLATKTKHLANNNLEVMAQELHQISQNLIDLNLKLANLQQPKPVDYENPELIDEWVSTYGYDYDSSFSDAVEVELVSDSYGDEIRINAEKETDSSSRDKILINVIEKYLEWAKNQKETQEQEADEYGY